ncbi:hypothetical protein BKA93DRAFT_33298 [Sparassis latifolia]
MPLCCLSLRYVFAARYSFVHAHACIKLTASTKPSNGCSKVTSLNERTHVSARLYHLAHSLVTRCNMPRIPHRGLLSLSTEPMVSCSTPINLVMETWIPVDHYCSGESLKPTHVQIACITYPQLSVVPC